MENSQIQRFDDVHITSKNIIGYVAKIDIDRNIVYVRTHSGIVEAELDDITKVESTGY
jgi:hypothetical protein